MSEASLSRAERARRQMRFWAWLLFKASVTSALVWWLLNSGALELSRVGVLVEKKRVFLLTAANWLTITVGFTTFRWRLLLQGIDCHVSFFRAAGLQTMALFFNGVVPGNIGGDFMKNHAVMGAKGGRLLVLVLVERTVGVVSLVWVAGIGLVLNAQRLGSSTQFSVLMVLIVLLIAGSIVVPWLLLHSRFERSRGEPSAQPSRSGPFGRLRGAAANLLDSVLVSFQLVREAKPYIVKAFIVSFFMHLGNMLYFLFLTRELGSGDAGIAQIASVFPIGMLSLVLPVSISGLGVGHVMFNELFRIVGLSGGANVFNVYIVAQLAPSLLGAVPYVLMKASLRRES